MVVNWSIQTLQRGDSGSGLEDADYLQKSGSGVDWSMQTLYRRLVVVVEWTGECSLFTEEW